MNFSQNYQFGFPNCQVWLKFVRFEIPDNLSFKLNKECGMLDKMVFYESDVGKRTQGRVSTKPIATISGKALQPTTHKQSVTGKGSSSARRGG